MSQYRLLQVEILQLSKVSVVFSHPKTLFHFPTLLQLETAPEGSGRWRAYNELLKDNPSAWYSDHKEADLAVANEPMTLIAADAIKGHQNEYGMYGVSGMDDGIPTPLAMAVQARRTFFKKRFRIQENCLFSKIWLLEN